MDLHLARAVATGLLLTLQRRLSAGRAGTLGALILALLLVGPGLILKTGRGAAPDAGVSTGSADPATVVPSPARVDSPATRPVEGQACSLHRPEKGLCGLPSLDPTRGEHPPRLSD